MSFYPTFPRFPRISGLWSPPWAVEATARRQNAKTPAKCHAYLPSSSGEIIAPAVVFAGPTGVWRGVRDGMGCALCIALGRRLCRSIVVAFDAPPRTATLAPGSLSENNEQCSNKSRSHRQERECHGPRVAGQACDRDWW